MAENENVGVVGEATPEELLLRKESAVEAAITNLRTRERAQLEADVVKLINELEDDIDRSAVPAIETINRSGETLTRTSSPTEPIYRRMSGEEREWRNPDGDHWMAEWIRGCVRNDRGQMLQATAKLDGVFGRAVTAEGAAGASGAISDGTGGDLIPRPLENVVMIARDAVAKMRRFATLYTMTAQQHNIPTAGAMTAAMVAESTDGAANDEPAIASVQLVANTGLVEAHATKEVLADAAVNLVNIFATRGGGQLGVLEDNQAFRDGNGSAPNITKIDGTAHTETTSGILAYVDTLAMYYNVGQVYRDNAVWFIASNVLQLMANVRDGQGRPFYQGLMDVPGAITDDSGQVGSILRRPVYEVPFSDGEIWFGDPSAVYALGTRQGIEVDVSEHARFRNREVVWILTQRFGGINVDTVAARYAKDITSATSL